MKGSLRTTSKHGKNPGHHFDQPFNQLINGLSNFSAINIKLPDYVQEVVARKTLYLS